MDSGYLRPLLVLRCIIILEAYDIGKIHCTGWEGSFGFTARRTTLAHLLLWYPSPDVM